MHFLDVPWDRKDIAKALGAKWNAQAKRWYVPDGVDPAPFHPWTIQEAPEKVGPASQFAFHADRFALLNGEIACWKCKETTPVSAFLLDGYSEPDDQSGERVESTEQTVVHSVVGLNTAVSELIRQKAPWMRPGFSKTREQTYLAPHCQHCAALQGAWFLSEPGAPFFPQTQQEALRLTVQWFGTPIEIDGDPSWSSWTDWLPRQ